LGDSKLQSDNGTEKGAANLEMLVDQAETFIRKIAEKRRIEELYVNTKELDA
jgi:hypothetical protein